MAQDRGRGGINRLQLASHRTERCCRFCSHDHQNILRKYGQPATMGGMGNGYDNAPVASFLRFLKAEWIWGRTRHTRQDVEVAYSNK